MIQPEQIPVTNAGIVLLNPFLSMYFDRLGLTEQGKFRDDVSRDKAIVMLHYVATGEEVQGACQNPLYNLLCGAGAGHTAHSSSPLGETGRELTESMMQAVLHNWSILGNTSVAGLRETFISRQGLLHKTDESWRLTVEQKALDVLIDRLPWGFSSIFHPWMQIPVFVSWR